MIQQRREEYYIDRIVRLISISLREFPIFRKWLNNRGNSFFHWFNRDLQRLCEQILLAEDGRSNISASLRRIFAAGMRRGRRILITIFAYSCVFAQLKLLFQRRDLIPLCRESSRFLRIDPWIPSAAIILWARFREPPNSSFLTKRFEDSSLPSLSEFEIFNLIKIISKFEATCKSKKGRGEEN